MLHIKKIKPLFTNILVTSDKFEEDVKVRGIIQQGQKKNDLKLYQKVLAVGSTVRDIQVGDMVMINPINYVRRKYSSSSIQNDMDNNPIVSVNIPTVVVYNEEGNPQECLLITDRDVQYVFEGEEVADVTQQKNKKSLVVN